MIFDIYQVVESREEQNVVTANEQNKCLKEKVPTNCILIGTQIEIRTCILRIPRKKSVIKSLFEQRN